MANKEIREKFLRAMHEENAKPIGEYTSVSLSENGLRLSVKLTPEMVDIIAQTS